MTVEEYISGINQAASLLRNGQESEALEKCIVLEKERPERMGAYLLISQIQFNQGSHDLAEATLVRGIEKTNDYQLYLSLGVILSKLHRYPEAVDKFSMVDSGKINNVPALFNYGRSLAAIGRLDDAITLYRKALKIDPTHKASLNNLANVFQKQEKYEQAIQLYEQLTQNYPNEAMGLCNLGSLYEKLNQLEKTIQLYQQAIVKEPGLAIAYYNLAHLYAGKLNNHELALQTIEKGLLKSKGPFIDGMRYQQIISRQHVLDWSNYTEDITTLDVILGNYIKDENPVFEVVPYNLSYSRISNTLYKSVAEKYASGIQKKVEEQFPNVSFDHSASQGKIKIGYYSPNFRIHPGGLLIRDLFDYHDSKEFEIHAFSLVHTDDFVNKNVQDSVDYYHDVSSKTSVEIAELINRTGIDILVALAGYNASMKMDVLALKPAPIQVEIIGSHETTGAQFVNYIFSDEYMMDEKLRKNFSENVITLPCSLLINSSLPEDTSINTTRSDHDLPGDGFVFAAFNHPKKLDPETFEVWLQILREASNSILWIYDGGMEAARNHILSYASKHSVDADRIVFAGRKDIHHHWERFKHADLFLDNFIYNAHVTGIEALRLKKPIVTLKGDNHNSRLCSSLLHYAGLDQLIADSKEAYVDIALQMIDDQRFKNRVIKTLGEANGVLFDSKAQIKYLEKAYKMAYNSMVKNGQFKDLIVGSLLKFDSFS